MQKALVQMNIQLANVISEVAGATGQQILRAIVAGERDGHVLAAMRDKRIRASSDEIAKSLEGNWRASWLALCPGTRITGGKVTSSKTKRVVNRAAQAPRLAAASLRNSQSALGAFHRRLGSRMDKPKAITVTAHKLARLIYTMLTKGEDTPIKDRNTSKNATANAPNSTWPNVPKPWE